MEFRRLKSADAEAYFANRLRALENAPSAFLTTLAEEKARGLDFFKGMLAEVSDDRLIFGAVKEDRVVGTIGLRREERPKTAHKALIWGMHVDDDQRRLGVGGRLLDLAIAHARDGMKAAAVYLTVESENHKALRLYESRGFNTWGCEPMATFEGGQFLAENHMFLKLAP